MKIELTEVLICDETLNQEIKEKIVVKITKEIDEQIENNYSYNVVTSSGKELLRNYEVKIIGI